MGSNPLYARPTCHLKLSQNVNWFDESRSTVDQHLTERFLIKWSEALLRDWHKETPMIEMPSWDSLVKTRANNPNILTRDKHFDMQLEVMMST